MPKNPYAVPPLTKTPTAAMTKTEKAREIVRKLVKLRASLPLEKAAGRKGELLDEAIVKARLYLAAVEGRR